MITSRVRETDWAQRYRPSTLDEAILPQAVRVPLERMAANRVPENMILVGRCGVGKTASATALCQDLDCDVLMVNGSLDNRIEHLRDVVEPFAHTFSRKGGKKVVFFDEAERLSREYQDGLRGFMERVSSNCTFIFTTNDARKISDAICSRCLLVEFVFSPQEKGALMRAFADRLQKILANENVTCDVNRIARIVTSIFPEFRQILKQVQVECMKAQISSVEIS